MTQEKLWWQRGIVYQIYPRSFQDSNGDGVGDLPGITQRLDYLHWLGIDAIWISPMYPSPMADFGYDIADYTNVDPMFGTLDDFDALIAAAHQRNIRIILDYVPGHTSDQHPWFIESRSSRDNPKRDWYIWRDPAPGGGPPTNWIDHFSGQPAWVWDETTQQYYYHTFLAEQPELNWRNPELKAAMFDVLRFWLDRGVDGFRVDVAHRIIKDDQFRDNPPNPEWREGMDPFTRLLETYTRNRPELHDIFREVRAILDSYGQKVLIGEISVPLEELANFYGDDDEFHLPFNFHLIHSAWEASVVRDIVDRFEATLPDHAWPNWVLGNHDQHRFASRTRPEQARVGMMLLLTLRGTPTVYYGDELGMHDVEIPPDRVQDPWEKNVPGLGLGRDPERTPMQWDDGPNAGFCPPDVEPWLPIAADFDHNNVATERSDPRSMLALTRALVDLRRTLSTLIDGSYRSVDAPPGMFAYIRESEQSRLLIALNFTDQPQSWPLPADFDQGTLLLSTHMDLFRTTVSKRLKLRPNEGVILQSESSFE